MGCRYLRHIAAGLVFFLVMCAGMLLDAATTAADVDRSLEIRTALTDSRRSLDLQTDWPGEEKDKTTEDDKLWWFEWLKKFLGKLRLSENMARYILAGALIVVLVAILFHLQENLWSNSRSRRLRARDGEICEAGGTPERMDKAQVEAEELAQSGSFAEAMHVLLLESVNELRRRLDVAIAASLTSREILQRIALPKEGRHAFADIIGRVEISYFGLHEPGEEEYLACRQSFSILTRALYRGKVS